MNFFSLLFLHISVVSRFGHRRSLGSERSRLCMYETVDMQTQEKRAERIATHALPHFHAKIFFAEKRRGRKVLKRTLSPAMRGQSGGGGQPAENKF